jgi:DNA-binding response OmpR family regulator
MGEEGAKSERVCRPESFPRERIVVGELHLIRSRIDALLAMLSGIATEEACEEWLRVEEATRIARRALSAAATAAPPLPATAPRSGELVVGRLRVDTASRRQWWGEAEFELTPLHHRLLAVMAADPYRVFAKDELLRLVWRRGPEATNAVNTSVSRVRRALEAAGAPSGRFMLSVHGVGWALTRPD